MRPIPTATSVLTSRVAATAVAVIAGVTGFFAVLRGSTFAAHAIPNGAFAGAAGASLRGLPGRRMDLAFLLVMAILPVRPGVRPGPPPAGRVGVLASGVMSRRASAHETPSRRSRGGYDT